MDPKQEREALRSALDRRRMLRAAGALMAEHGEQRASEEVQRTAILADPDWIQSSPASRKVTGELAATRRRDQLARALDYPMTGEELISAAQAATLAGRVRQDLFDEVVASLLLEVTRRHGPEPSRAKVSPNWLRTRASKIGIDVDRATERKTGMRAAAEQVSLWAEQDKRAGRAIRNAGGDVWNMAAGMAAPPMAEQLDPEAMAARLGLSPGKADALALAIDADRITPMSGAARVAWHKALKVIRAEFPTVEALRLALRPDHYAAMLLVDRAMPIARAHAAQSARGSHLAGSPLQAASSKLLSRWAGPEGPTLRNLALSRSRGQRIGHTWPSMAARYPDAWETIHLPSINADRAIEAMGTSPDPWRETDNQADPTDRRDLVEAR